MGGRAASRSVRVLGALAVLVAVVTAFFVGVLTERMRFDSHRDALLKRYNQALQQHQKQIMDSEKAPR